MRLSKRSSRGLSSRRPMMARPLKPWLLAAGVLVSFTATAGIRTNVDPATPGLRFDGTPENLTIAWPTLTAPDIAAAAEDFIPARPSLLAEPPSTEPEEDPQLQPGFWRAAQPTDGSEYLYEATPEISVLFRLGGEMMPAARPFSEDDGGLIVGAFSGLVPAESAALAALPAEPAPSPADAAQAKPEMRVAAAVLPPAPSVKISLPTAARTVAPKSPLVGTVTSEREMKCLAEAVYFESRSEPERGQAGVAQVVLNRVRSGVYPSTVCGVVYQNRHRYLACQFTFACEGKALRTNEPGPWATAQRIARDVAEGRTYLPGVGNATHYHANYVRPWWARYMDKREKVGKHIFYFESAEN
jgi:spore germination cell wall hydrolase CwlJ-like protein